MTRDEAIEAVRTAVMQQRRENEINLTELLVDAMFALGVLKLDDPFNAGKQHASDWREISGCEPPPEHREKRWHWVTRRGRLQSGYWMPETSEWLFAGWANPLKPEDMTPLIWRYVSPCPMPQESES